MVASYVYAGRPMASMFSRAAKMILYQFGLLPNLQLLPAAKGIIHGSPLYALIHGDVTAEIIASVA
jgi:hypothetical protein